MPDNAPSQPERTAGIKIATLYAWIVTAPDGTEAVCEDVNGIPVVGCDRDTIANSSRGTAENIRRRTGWPVKLKMFTAGVTIDTLP